MRAAIVIVALLIIAVLFQQPNIVISGDDIAPIVRETPRSPVASLPLVQSRAYSSSMPVYTPCPATAASGSMCLISIPIQ